MAKPKRKRNLSVGLPRNKWVNARIRVTSGGKIQATVDENILGNLLGGKKKNTRKKKHNPKKIFKSRFAASAFADLQKLRGRKSIVYRVAGDDEKGIWRVWY